MPEFNVYGVATQPDGELQCTAGICDAVAYENDKPAALVDWKSDVAPTIDVQQKHATQLRDYLKLTGCELELIES